ncbi:MAG: HAD family hydrolase [Alphaproteobacteria bacterium]
MRNGKPPDLVIFDCDGVLVDSEPIFSSVHADILSQCGYETTPEIVGSRFCGISDAEMLAAIEREWGRRLPADYDKRVAALLDASCEASLTALPGIRETLDLIQAPICVASSSTPERVRRSLGIVGLLDRFEPHIFSAVMVARGKPAPDLFLFAARAMDADPARCVVIEDSVPGVRAAVSARMAVIGFCGGSHCPAGHAEILRRNGAMTTITDFRDLPPSIETLALPPRGIASPISG